MLEHALIAGLFSVGTEIFAFESLFQHQVLFTGFVHNRLMLVHNLTASHNPAEDNSVSFFCADGRCQTN